MANTHLTTIAVDLSDRQCYQKELVEIHGELRNLLIRYGRQQGLPAEKSGRFDNSAALNHALKAFFANGTAEGLGYEIEDARA